MKIALFHQHANDPLSWAIKAITRGQYVHAALLDDQTIIEAYYPHVRSRPATAADYAGIDLFEVPGMSGAFDQKIRDWADGQVKAATAYDITDLFRFLPVARAVIGEASGDAWKRHMFCSMFVFDAFRFAGLPLLNCHDFECCPNVLSWSPLLRKQ